MVICLEQGVDLLMAQLVPLPLSDSCFSKIQISFTFLVPAHPGSPGKRAVKRACECRPISAENYSYATWLSNKHTLSPYSYFFALKIVEDIALQTCRPGFFGTACVT